MKPTAGRVEIKPHRSGWKVFEAPGVEPVFPKKAQIESCDAFDRQRLPSCSVFQQTASMESEIDCTLQSNST
jgi:hypothetical protein